MGERAPWRPPLLADDQQESKISRQKTEGGYQQRPKQNDGAASSNDIRRRNNRGEGARQRRPPHQHRRQLQDGDPQKTTPKALADPALRSLILTLCKSQLQTQQRTRRLEGALTDTILMPDKHPVAQALRREARTHQAEAERRRELIASSAPDDAAATVTQSLPPLGPPDIAIFVALIEQLATQDIGELPKQKLIEAARRANTMEQTEVLETVQVCRIYPTANSEQSRISLIVQKGELRTLILAALANLKDVKCLTGQARPGWLEEDLSLWVDTLTNN